MNEKNKNLIFFKPVFKEVIWGGSRLNEMFHYQTNDKAIGEAWCVSAHKNGDCEVISQPWAGKKLSELWRDEKYLFGNLQMNRFPLLVKIIDAKENLSVQAHPDDMYASIYENGEWGKTECWYVLDCNSDASVIIGHKAKTKEELKELALNGEWDKLLQRRPVKKGDFFQINPGTIHAIQAGTLILEIQQNSDITYRLFDYNRNIKGMERELHLDKALDVIRVPWDENECTPEINDSSSLPEITLFDGDFYKVWKLNISKTERFKTGSHFVIMTAIEGRGYIDGIKIQKGNNFIIPYQYGSYVIEGNITLICSGVPDHI